MLGPATGTIPICNNCDLLVGLDGLHVVGVERDDGGGLRVSVESAPIEVGCPACGVVASSHGRRVVRLVDSPCFGRPVDVLWRKRTWECPEPSCPIGTFTEQDVCNICSNPRRQENGQICVVESPADIYAIEQTGQFSGRYFVLMGHLSPLDGIGPDDIGLDRLEQRLASEQINELILATNPTVEGEATANYIAELCMQYGVEASRIAHGVPVGGELEMVDGTTLSHSLAGRHKIKF